jgi:hypothetical protein
MKKILIAVAFACTALFASAQNTVITSKNGIPILPETKDWGLGFDASPFFDVIKGIFSSSDTSGASYTNFTKNHPLSIYGKYVKDPNTIWRLNARLNFTSKKNNYATLLDTSSNSTGISQYGDDVLSETDAGITLGFGIEKRRGKGRVQGYYGPEIMVGYSSAKITANYANALSVDNQNPTISPPLVIDPVGHRVKEQKDGTTFNFGIRGFVGVEYFFMAKASIGAEFGWGISYVHRGEPETKIESWDPSLNSGDGGIKTDLVNGDALYHGKISGLIVDSDNAYGALNLIFYF